MTQPVSNRVKLIMLLSIENISGAELQMAGSCFAQLGNISNYENYYSVVSSMSYTVSTIFYLTQYVYSEETTTSDNF